MPELPEVETIVRGLRPRVVSRRIVGFDSRQPKAINLPLEDFRAQVCQSVGAIDRRGKSIVLRLESADLWLHLGLQGQALHDPADLPLPAAEPAIQLAFDDGSRLRLEKLFMGHAHVFTPAASAAKEKALGVDPLAETSESWLLALAARKPNLGAKAALMDQAIVAGVGNVYSDEALHRARLLPARKLGSLSAGEVARLWAAVREVLAESISLGGDESYSDISGTFGRFTSRVHHRDTCVTCGGATLKQVIGGRGGYLCPACQS